MLNMFFSYARAVFVNEWPEADGNMIWRFQRQNVEKGGRCKDMSTVRVRRH
jgi:hypothetical protein